MSRSARFAVAVIAPAQLLPTGPIWGTGGWMSPAKREALDWFTLARFLGWTATCVPLTANGDLSGSIPDDARVIILASDGGRLSGTTVAALASHVQHRPALIVGRAGPKQSAWSELAGAHSTGRGSAGRAVRWQGPGDPLEMTSRQDVSAAELECLESQIWAALEDRPLIAARALGKGVAVSLGMHPSEIRDADPTGTALMKLVLTHGTPPPVAWLDFDHTLVLRMDDPGGAQNVYSRTWCYPKLDSDAWAAIGRDLASRHARISLAYTPGWVDDGDRRRGHLMIDGRHVDRVPGAVHPSPLVRYEDVGGHAPGTVHDYQSEFRGIEDLRRAGVADVELHGYTHIHPDRTAWLKAPDRFETWPDTAWYRELGPAAAAAIDALAPADHPLNRGVQLLAEFFGTRPTTLICPGDQWTTATLERALTLGFELVDSYYMAIRDQDMFCWTLHVCAPYLDEPDASWFGSGLPVVGYFHDAEPAMDGVGWMTNCLDRWQAAGARRLIDFRELAAALDCRLAVDEREGRLDLVVERNTGSKPVRPIPIRVRSAGHMPATLTVRVGSDRAEVSFETRSGSEGTALLPVI